VGRSAESIAAGYLGFLCLFLALFALLPFAFVLVLPLAALTAWLAIRALGKASTGGHGRGRATFGLIGAGLATLLGLGGMISTFTQ
jgi:membrane protein implicated in regulation of membrane protease activity